MRRTCERTAWPLTTGAVPSVFEPARNVTVPVMPDAMDETVAVSATLAPAAAVAGPANDTDVSRLRTVTVFSTVTGA